MKTFGIDISKWQGEFNFDKAISEGVKFCILRGAYSVYKDTKFDDFYAKAKSKGLPVGVYQYSMATTVAQAKNEAQWLYDNILKGRQFELPVYLDVEDAVQKALGKSLLTPIVKAWCDALEGKGFYVGIYSSRSYFASYMDDTQLQGYTHWIAEWSTKYNYANTSIVGMWQYGGETNQIRSNKIAGVTCDQDYMLVDFPTIIKAKGLNGFTKSSANIKQFNGFNQQRRKDNLIIYTNSHGAKTRTNIYGREVRVDKYGYVMDNPTYGLNNKAIPSGGFVISGNGAGSAWLKDNIKKGMQVSYNSNSMMLTIK